MLSVSLLAPMTVLGAEEDVTEKTKASLSASAVDTTTYMGQVVIGLLVVLLLIFAIAAFIKRFGHGQLGVSQQITIIGSLALGAKERLVLVEVGEEQLLLGVSAAGINTLHKLQEPIRQPDTSEDLSEFGAKLKDILTRSTTHEP